MRHKIIPERRPPTINSQFTSLLRDVKCSHGRERVQARSQQRRELTWRRRVAADTPAEICHVLVAAARRVQHVHDQVAMQEYLVPGLWQRQGQRCGAQCELVAVAKAPRAGRKEQAGPRAGRQLG